MSKYRARLGSFDLYPEILTHSIRNIEKRDTKFLNEDLEKTMDRINELIRLIKERNINAKPYAEKELIIDDLP